MVRALICWPLAVLFLASVLPSNAQTEGDAGAVGGDLKLLYFDVRHNITLDCSALAPDDDTKIVWKKNGTLVEQIPELKDRYDDDDGHFVIKRRAQEDDAGNYTCAVAAGAGGAGAGRGWELRARTHAKLPANTNVVEEQKIKLSCKLIGKPYLGVVWTYSNTSESVETNSSVELRQTEGGRVTLGVSEQGVQGAELVLEAATLEDAGWYRCTPLGPGSAPAVTQLRVKDKYAALWPFLGICAEVFVLCAIILIYERRRTKPELDDSDTDNHDQKKS